MHGHTNVKFLLTHVHTLRKGTAQNTPHKLRIKILDQKLTLGLHYALMGGTNFRYSHFTFYLFPLCLLIFQIGELIKYVVYKLE